MEGGRGGEGGPWGPGCYNQVRCYGARHNKVAFSFHYGWAARVHNSPVSLSLSLSGLSFSLLFVVCLTGAEHLIPDWFIIIPFTVLMGLEKRPIFLFILFSVPFFGSPPRARLFFLARLLILAVFIGYPDHQALRSRRKKRANGGGDGVGAKRERVGVWL